MPRRYDAEQLPRRERQEVEAGMMEPIAHRDAITPAEQEKIDGLLDLEDVDVDPQVGISSPHPLDRAGHHDLGNAGHRTNAQLRQRTMSDLGDDLAEVVDFLVNTVVLFKDVLGFGRWEIAPALALEESDTKRFLGLFHQSADTRRRHVEKLGRAANGARHHDRPDNLDLV